MADSDLSGLAERHGLQAMGVRPPFWRYLADAWRRRDFALTLAAYRLQAGTSKTRLGMGWIVLRPLLNAVIYGVIFGFVMPKSSRPDNFIAYLIVGVFIFEFFSRSFSEGARSVIQNVNLLKNLSFPRILLPISAVLQQLLELAVMVVVMVVILLVLGEPITFGWLMIVPVLLMMTLFNIGVALLAARLTVHFMDIMQIIPQITRILFYSSGIFFSLPLVFADMPELLFVAQLNPVHDFIALVRGFMVSGMPVEPLYWWVTSGFTALFLSLGVVLFWRAENLYGRDQ